MSGNTQKTIIKLAADHVLYHGTNAANSERIGSHGFTKQPTRNGDNLSDPRADVNIYVSEEPEKALHYGKFVVLCRAREGTSGVCIEPQDPLRKTWFQDGNDFVYCKNGTSGPRRMEACFGRTSDLIVVGIWITNPTAAALKGWMSIPDKPWIKRVPSFTLHTVYMSPIAPRPSPVGGAAGGSASVVPSPVGSASKHAVGNRACPYYGGPSSAASLTVKQPVKSVPVASSSKGKKSAKAPYVPPSAAVHAAAASVVMSVNNPPTSPVVLAAVVALAVAAKTAATSPGAAAALAVAAAAKTAANATAAALAAAAAAKTAAALAAAAAANTAAAAAAVSVAAAAGMCANSGCVRASWDQQPGSTCCRQCRVGYPRNRDHGEHCTAVNNETAMSRDVV